MTSPQRLILDWYAAHGRDLPWRRTRDPYRILVAEVMLQQTQVDRVLPKYEQWLAAFPTLAALAEAPTSEVIRLWSPLGYNSRAVRLQGIARQCVERHGGRIWVDSQFGHGATFYFTVPVTAQDHNSGDRPS